MNSHAKFHKNRYVVFLSFFTILGCDITLAQSTSDVTTAVVSSLPQFIPVAIVVAIIGLIGSLHKTKVDRQTGSEGNNARIFEAVIKDNASLRAEKDKANENLRAKDSENAILAGKIQILEMSLKNSEDNRAELRSEIAELKRQMEEGRKVRERYVRLCRIIESNAGLGNMLKELNVSLEIYTE